jgi:hemerythrin
MKHLLQMARWSKAFLIGVPELDDEHRGLFAAVSELCRVAASGNRPNTLLQLRLIAKHTAEHFGHEERLMRRAGYYGYRWHRQQHETAKKRLGPLVQAARCGGTPECERLVAFLSDWLPNHIAVHDCMMSAAIRNYQLFKRSRLSVRQASA